MVEKNLEETVEIIQPISPKEPITMNGMTSIIISKINETIELVNVLREEVLKIKEKDE